MLPTADGEGARRPAVGVPGGDADT